MATQFFFFSSSSEVGCVRNTQYSRRAPCPLPPLLGDPDIRIAEKPWVFFSFPLLRRQTFPPPPFPPHFWQTKGKGDNLFGGPFPFSPPSRAIKFFRILHFFYLPPPFPGHQPRRVLWCMTSSPFFPFLLAAWVHGTDRPDPPLPPWGCR